MVVGILFKWCVFLAMSMGVIFGGLMVISRRNPIHCALFMVMSFFCTAVLYLIMNQPFIAVLQVLVYSGAIMMLIIFVIMLLRLEEEKIAKLKFSYTKLTGTILGIIFFFQLLMGVIAPLIGKTGKITAEVIAKEGSTVIIAKELFTRYLLIFELSSVLLLVAIIGAVVLSKGK
ncbi:MAG: NADH-quinone oxidoreductase subunit J [Spirochaetes bacterium]|nr:NADH-quinone oxidoreductase subunit J [Deltaproteobacteria bacterium]RKY03843.1 MAG: NADH-quinone oxidoreductase subunit J [Spirochaetota bacterium]